MRRLLILMLAALTACSPVTRPSGTPTPEASGSPAAGKNPSFWTPSSWPNYQWNDKNNAVFPGDLEVSWTFDTGGKVNGSLGIAGRTIFVNSFSKKVWAIDLVTGQPRWSRDVPRIVMSTPIVSDGLVIVGTGTNDLLEDKGERTIWGTPQGDDVIALRERDGSIAWKFHTVGEDMPTPAVLGGKLIFSNGDMHAYALDVKTGRLIWKTAIPGVTTMSATTFSDGLAFLVASHGLDYIFSDEASHMLGVNIDNGRIVWSANHGNADCSPTVADHLVVCEGSTYVWYGKGALGWMGKNDVEAFDTRTGRNRWRWVGNVGYYTAVGSSERGISGMVHDHILYQPIPTTDEVIAFRLSDGTPIWRFHTAGAVKMSPLYWKGKIIFGDTAGLLYSVNAGAGDINNIVAENQPFSTSAPVIVGKTLYIAGGSILRAIPLKQVVL